MTNNKEDFIGSTKPMEKKVLGVRNYRAKITKYANRRYVIQDNKGVQCKLPISRLYYCESVPYKVIVYIFQFIVDASAVSNFAIMYTLGIIKIVPSGEKTNTFET
jgi:hypothetical protein